MDLNGWKPSKMSRFQEKDTDFFFRYIECEVFMEHSRLEKELGILCSIATFTIC